MNVNHGAGRVWKTIDFLKENWGVPVGVAVGLILPVSLAMGLLEVDRVDKENEAREIDVAVGLACGTSDGPFEVEGKSRVTSWQKIGGRTMIKEESEFYLVEGSKRNIWGEPQIGSNGTTLMYVGKEYEWENEWKTVSLVVNGNDGKVLTVGWRAACKEVEP